MRNKASGLLKQIIATVTTMARSKSMAIKSKTKAIKTRLVIFSLLHQNRKLFMTSFSDKLNTLMGHHNDDKNSNELLEDDACGGDQQSQAIVLYNTNNAMWVPSTAQTKYEDEEEDGDDDDGDGDEVEEKYPDMSHSVLETEVIEMEDPRASVIDMVKNSKEGKGEEFRLEDEIDRVADLFIKRFHRQMRMQKQHSLKRSP